ncbi:MAG: RNA-directed DNA polymerase [Salinibacterium sp.]|nr:RNA-directed DNA polymerase [Salinibacterium sp.]
MRKSGAKPDKILKAEDRLKSLRAKREDLVTAFVGRVRDALEDPTFGIGISVSYRAKGVDVYRLDAPYAINFMAVKALSLNLRRAFSIRPSSRDDIVSQVTRLLNDHYPKSVIRGDVSKFYESIDHSRLLDTLRESSVLSTATLTLIAKLLKSYSDISGSTVGLPRGIGLSADLSEVFMRSLDAHFTRLDSVVFYTRFVDDILIVSHPGNGANVLSELDVQLSARGLSLNRTKSSVREMANDGTLAHIPFLGYSLEYRGRRLLVGLSPNRLEKIKRRLDASFASYTASRSPSAKAKTMLMKRVRFLSTNTRLANNKRRAFVGIRFSNRFVNDPSQLASLDARLAGHIATLSDAALAKKLGTYSFIRGWSEGTFTRHRLTDFEAIASAWRKLG